MIILREAPGLLESWTCCGIQGGIVVTGQQICLVRSRNNFCFVLEHLILLSTQPHRVQCHWQLPKNREKKNYIFSNKNKEVWIERLIFGNEIFKLTACVIVRLLYRNPNYGIFQLWFWLFELLLIQSPNGNRDRCRPWKAACPLRLFLPRLFWPHFDVRGHCHRPFATFWWGVVTSLWPLMEVFWLQSVGETFYRLHFAGSENKFNFGATRALLWCLKYLNFPFWIFWTI